MPGIPSETRRSVLEAAKELGYRLSSGAPYRLSSLALIVKADADLPPNINPFYSHVMAGVENSCWQKKITLLYASLPVDDENCAVEIPHLLREQDVDGYLIVGALINGALEECLKDKDTPVILVDSYDPARRYDSVLSANFCGAYQAVRHLIRMGHQSIGCVGGSEIAYPSIRERRQGYLRALADHGLKAPYLAGTKTLKSSESYSAVLEMLTRYPEVSAIFGCNDELSFSVFRAAQALGRKIPGDLSVIGFDNVETARHVTPGLTTMHVDKVSMGRLAVRALAERLEAPEMERITISIHPRLVERESAAPVNRTEGERNIGMLSRGGDTL